MRSATARHGMGPPAARAERLVVGRVRRARRQRQAADEHSCKPATCGSCGREAARRRHDDVQAKSYRWRSTLVFALVVLGAAGLAARAVELQLLDHGFLAKQGDDRSMRVVKIAAHRGAITDRNGEPLAMSTPVDSIWVNPQEINDNIDQLPKLAQSAAAGSAIARAAHHEQSRPRISLPGAPHAARAGRLRQVARHPGRLLAARIPALLPGRAKSAATSSASRRSTIKARRAWNSATTSC
jgi:cell division protein FtsI/penicillin-binding protein 2